MSVAGRRLGSARRAGTPDVVTMRSTTFFGMIAQPE